MRRTNLKNRILQLLYTPYKRRVSFDELLSEMNDFEKSFDERLNNERLKKGDADSE